MNEVSHDQREEITRTIFLTQYCTLILLICEPCSPSTECPPIQCLKLIAQIGVGADQGMEFRILSLTTEYSVASFSILNLPINSMISF